MRTLTTFVEHGTMAKQMKTSSNDPVFNNFYFVHILQLTHYITFFIAMETQRIVILLITL